MSNSKEQSLDENVIFLPVDESSPEFLYCEKEREAVERLLNAGPEAFYSSLNTERSGCFLSSEEVSQLTSWVKTYHFNEPQVTVENGVESSAEMEDFCSSYFPSHSDLPPPSLELGWPEKGPWLLQGSVTVHSSPAADGEPSVREIIRRHLQEARQVIAIVTDRLTDGAIIGDLHNAASRDVPVYIILNQRSIQENFSLNRLRHPNMRVRILGGKTFCSRTGRMVVGEMKEKFLLVDLKTVIHGSYSLTWTDAHLHRQLITVLRGPVVDSFDREFRILYAASLPVPDTWRDTGSHVNMSYQLKEFSDYGLQKQVPLEPEITSTPSPPPVTPLDWEEMGVFQTDNSMLGSPFDQYEEIMFKKMPLQNSMLVNKKTAVMDEFTNNENHFVDKRRIHENLSPVTTEVPEKSPSCKNTEPLSTEPATSERPKSRMEHREERATSRQIFTERSTPSHKYNQTEDRNTTRLDKESESTHRFSSTKRREYSKRDFNLEEKTRPDQTMLNVENKSSSKKPLILMTYSDSYGSLSDIMKKIQQSSSGLLKRRSNTTMTQSMMDLSVQDTAASHHDKRVPVPRFKASFDPDHMTPALSLMKKRNDDVKSTVNIYRPRKNFMPTERPRSSSFAQNTDWRRQLTEKK